MTSLESIQSFLSQEKIAVAGVSRKKQKFGNAIYKELAKKGYEVFAVNPNMDDYEGKRCVRISTPSPLRLVRDATVEWKGEEVPARYEITSSGYSIVELATGIPWEASYDYKGYMFLKPDGTGSHKIIFTYVAWAKRVN